MKGRNINICCVQETKWKVEKAKEIRDRYKIIYLGKTSTRKGVILIIDKEMKSKVVDVVRKSNRLIVVKLLFEEKP